ncbi:hypothetical protein HZU77_013300 [Neisseriaceae bacterium TC5R-5]|nr:hypothetical protein [Neisseriaceae bacterium TC5R-5]
MPSFGSTVSDVIAIGAAVVSLGSAIFSYMTWTAANRANEISLFSPKKEIYDQFSKLAQHMDSRWAKAELCEVTKFNDSISNAELYLPTSLAEDIKKYYFACFDVADLNRVNYQDQDLKEREMQKCNLQIAQELQKKIKPTLFELLQNAQHGKK